MRYIPNKALLITFCITGLLLAACHQQEKPLSKKPKAQKNWDHSIEGSFSTQVALKLDSSQIDTFFKYHPDLKNMVAQVKGFYRNRDLAYAWYEKGQFIEQANNLANRVMNLQNDGVYKQIPYQKALDSLMHDESGRTGKNKPDPNLELLLTAQYFAFAKIVYEGVDQTVSKANGWNVPRKKINYNQYLDSLLASKQQTADPVYRQYDLLKTYLKKYRQLDAVGNWQQIVSKKINFGDSLAVVRTIKKRLADLGDLKGDTTGILFDDAAKVAVQYFQKRNGLAENGIVDAATLAALNVPLKTRITQILVNMERCRWVPVSLSGDYLAVNIPEFALHVYHADSLLWSCNVVVGQTMHPTTIFSGEVKYVVFSPYWNVPPSIVRAEILPGIRKNPGYLSKHHMQIVGKEGGLPVVRQEPGETNSLGLVKFLFPNSYNIYLHDTPSRSLFGETSRAFSHGCIRVGQPAKLAAFLLPDSTKWTAQKISAAMHKGKEQTVTLKNKVPVFIAYFTAFVDRDGQLNFRKDVYQLDARLASTLIAAN